MKSGEGVCRLDDDKRPKDVKSQVREKNRAHVAVKPNTPENPTLEPFTTYERLWSLMVVYNYLWSLMTTYGLRGT